MIDTNEEDYLHLKSLLESIEGQPLKIDWVRHWDDVNDLGIFRQYDIVLAMNGKGNRLNRPDISGEKELNELKSRFVAMASHEFRTPLTSISSSADLVEAYMIRGDFEGVGKHLARIKNSVNDLDNILTDFLSLDKLEEGITQPHFRELNLPEMVAEVRDVFEQRLKPGQTILYEHEGSAFVSLDPELLKIILVNLISNASKYSSPKAPILVNTRVTSDLMTLTVADRGIGISEEDMSRLFGRFYRARNATNIQGTGLGLYVTKCYVEMMRGQISCSSELDKGSTFLVEFQL